MTIAVMIPIKEKSQRVPNKSFRTLGIKGLPFHVIDTLLSMEGYRMDIWINTDSEKVIDYIVKHYQDTDLGNQKLRYYIRSEDVRGHEVSMNTVIDDWIMECNNQGFIYDEYLQTHITNPFMTAQIFYEALKQLRIHNKSGKNRSVMGVTRHQCRMWHSAQPVNFTPNEIIQTQDLKPVFEDNSCVYAFTKSVFDKYGRVSRDPYMLEIPYPENLDIDTEDDWMLASYIAEG